MIRVRHRFHGHNSLNGVYSRGQTVRSPHISLKYTVRRRGQAYRVAVVVSRKVHKSAVVRNRIRRRVYEIVRQSDEALLVEKDLIFTVFSEQIATVENAKLASTIEGLLQKAIAKPDSGTETPVRHGIVNKRHGK